MSMAVTTLIENTLSAHKGLLCEHGLSFHVRTPDRSFLFDCGAGNHFLHNAERLCVDLRDLDFVACSHSHYDHGGGFRPLAGQYGVSRVVTGTGYFESKYEVKDGRHAFVGVDFDERYLEGMGIEHDVCGDLMDVAEDCWLAGNFERTCVWERPPEKFMILRDGRFEPDLFLDEICLAFLMDDGIGIVTGCSHPGIVNMAGTVGRRFNLPVRGIWGGTHLVEADGDRIEKTLDALHDMGVRRLGLSHCSGEAALERVAADGRFSVCRMGTGDGVFI